MAKTIITIEFEMSESSQTTGKRLKWTDELDAIVIDMWAEKIDELRETRKSSHILKEMAAALKEAGFLGSWTDVRIKISNLTKKYREEKLKIGPSGGTPSLWAHYEKLHSILDKLRVNDDALVSLGNVNAIPYMEDPIEFDPEVSGCSTSTGSVQSPAAKRIRQDTVAELLEIARESLQVQKEQRDEQRLARSV